MKVVLTEATVESAVVVVVIKVVVVHKQVAYQVCVTTRWCYNTASITHKHWGHICRPTARIPECVRVVVICVQCVL